MPTVVDLGALGSQGFIATGEADYDRAGWSVSDAGDVNGDGFADIIIGAPLNDAGGDNAGKAYVIFGGPGGFGAFDLGNLQPADGIVIQGDSRADLAGFSVSGAGDINGDGFDDLIVGANTYGFYGSFSKAYIIFGEASPPGTIDLTSLAPSDGFLALGNYTYYSGASVSVSGAGDINGDGFDDIIIGTPYDGGGSGVAYVVFGKASGFTDIALPGISPPAGFEIRGGTLDLAGFSVSGAGDFNGDGFDDLVIGALYGPSSEPYAGEAYVIFGKASGFGNIDLSNLAAAAGFRIQGDDADDLAGRSVSAAGDVNGDGLDDIIIGAPLGNSGGAQSGEAYVIFGKTSGFGTIDLGNLAASAGFLIQGDESGDHAGWSVSAAGDVNNDGFADILVGAPENDNGGGENAGRAYVIFGKASGFGTIDLSNLAPSAGFLIQGAATGGMAGWSVSAAGDVDGDGFDDLIVGAPYSGQGGPQTGAAYIISGRLNFVLDARDDFNGDGRSDILWRNDDGTVIDWLGRIDGRFDGNIDDVNIKVGLDWQVAGVGDFNGDGRDDVIWRRDTGALAQWRGQADGGFAGNASANFSVATSWHVTGVGDFNGDGHDDILWRNDNMTVTDWLGRTDGRFDGNTDDANIQVGADWDVAGTGDFNGDGRDDVLWRNDDGRLFEWLGQGDGGFAANAGVTNAVAASWHIEGVGDFNGDGRHDILWRNDNGAVTDWLGRIDGRFDGNTDDANIMVGAIWDVASIGDFNGDGRDDVLWRNDNGRLFEWLGQVDGGFAANAGVNNVVAASWHVQSPDLWM